MLTGTRGAGPGWEKYVTAVDQVRIGGLMRCCLQTLNEFYPDGPAKKAQEGQRLHCRFCRTGEMVFRDGAWQWALGREEQ